jgi:enoyl-CoA hydratase/carnithine racemase
MPFRLLARAFDVPADWLLVGRVGLPDEPTVKKELERIRRRAPHALRIADALVFASVEHKLDEGLALELSRLREIFSTRDAREGLTALIEGRRPTFTGEAPEHKAHVH